MSVVMKMKWSGIVPEQYEKLRKTVNWEGNVPAGSKFHISSFSDNAIHVTDIWDSEKQFSDFAEKRLMPEIQKLGITSQPEMEFHTIHHIFNPGINKN